MPSAIFYRKNLIIAEVIFANLQEIAKFTKFIALEKKVPYSNTIVTGEVFRFVRTLRTICQGVAKGAI